MSTTQLGSFLGTPAIYINTLRVGYMEEDEERGLLFHPDNLDGCLAAVKQILREDGYQEAFKKRWEKLLQDKIDPTAFMVWFIENYPESKRVMRENPDYQFSFR